MDERPQGVNEHAPRYMFLSAASTSRSVLHRSGLSDIQHEVYTQLYTDGMPPDTASEAAENLA